MNGWFDSRKKRMFDDKVMDKFKIIFNNDEISKISKYIDRITYEDLNRIINEFINKKCVQKKY